MRLIPSNKHGRLQHRLCRYLEGILCVGAAQFGHLSLTCLAQLPLPSCPRLLETFCLMKTTSKGFYTSVATPSTTAAPTTTATTNYGHNFYDDGHFRYDQEDYFWHRPYSKLQTLNPTPSRAGSRLQTLYTIPSQAKGSSSSAMSATLLLTTPVVRPSRRQRDPPRGKESARACRVGIVQVFSVYYG